MASGDDQGEKEDHRQSISRGKRKERDVQARGCSKNAVASNATMSNSGQAAILSAPSVQNRSLFITVCPLCKREEEYSMIVKNHFVYCRHCNEFYVAKERKSFPPRTSATVQRQIPRRMEASNRVNVPSTDRFQYEYALKNPIYFNSILQSVSKEKNRQNLVPVIQDKELSLHQIFAEVTSRGGIHKVTREGRLPEVCATIDENLRDVDLHYIYMQLLYDIETMLCSSLTNSLSNSSSGQHPMQGVVGRNPSTSPASSSRGGQYPSQRIQASAPNTSSAPVKNNRPLMSQRIRPSALYTISEIMNINQQLSRQPIRASTPYASPAPVNINQRLTRQPIRASARYTSAVPLNVNQQMTRQPIRASAPHTSAVPLNINQQLTRQPIRASAPYTSAVPLNINQQFTRQPIRASTPYTNSTVYNNQQLTRQPIRASVPYTNSSAINNNLQLPGSSSDHAQSSRYLTDDPRDFPSTDEREVQPLQQMLESPDVGSTGIHGGSTSGIGIFQSNSCENAGEAEQSNSETGSSSPLASRKQS